MSQISLTFPDGNKRDYAAGITAAEVAVRYLNLTWEKGDQRNCERCALSICNGPLMQMQQLPSTP